jgi:hypothetical protein
MYPVKIDWLPTRIGLDYEEDLGEVLRELHADRELSVMWAGFNAMQRKESVFLQVWHSREDPQNRLAVLFGAWTRASGEKKLLLLREEHVAAAAAQLGWADYVAYPVPAEGMTTIRES